jgi:hypothetical protein
MGFFGSKMKFSASSAVASQQRSRLPIRQCCGNSFQNSTGSGEGGRAPRSASPNFTAGYLGSGFRHSPSRAHAISGSNICLNPSRNTFILIMTNTFEIILTLRAGARWRGVYPPAWPSAWGAEAFRCYPSRNNLLSFPYKVYLSHSPSDDGLSYFR